jgi:hypothetical protein
MRFRLFFLKKTGSEVCFTSRTRRAQHIELRLEFDPIKLLFDPVRCWGQKLTLEITVYLINNSEYPIAKRCRIRKPARGERHTEGPRPFEGFE